MVRISVVSSVFMSLVLATVWWRSEPVPERLLAQLVPLIHVDQPLIDLGSVPLTDDDLLFEYLIENWGRAPLRIEGSIQSCGCTTPELPPSEILPNQTAYVRLKIDPEAAAEKQVSVTLLTNDPVHPRFVLRAHWVTTNGLSVNPPHLDFGMVPAGQSQRLPIQMTVLDRRIQIASIASEPDTIQTDLVGDQLMVTIRPDAYPVSGYGVVRVSIAGGSKRPVLIPVRWQVDHAYQAYPHSLFLGYTQPGNELEGVVIIKDRDNRDVAASDWTWKEDLPGTHCEVTQDAQGRHQFSVRWTAPGTPGLHRGVILLQVSDHTLQVPVSGLVGTAPK